MILVALSIFFVSLFLSLKWTPFFIRFSFRFDFLDLPAPGRKKHNERTPLLGGVAVFLAFFSTLLIFFLLGSVFSYLPLENAPSLSSFYSSWLSVVKGAHLESRRLLLIFLGGLLVLLLGLKDDKKGMGPTPKLTTLFLIGLLLFYLNIRVTVFIESDTLSFVMTLVWILFLTNAFNLLDNMNGLSSGISACCSLNLLGISFFLEQHFISFYLLASLGSLLGFMRYNFPKGKIFLGDSGALFLGYNMVVVMILESFYVSGKSPHTAILIPFFVFSVPIYDTFSVIFIRLKQKRSIFQGDLNHFSHRLVLKGCSKKKAVMILWALSLLVGASSCLLLQYQLGFLLSLGFFLTIMLFFWVFERFYPLFAQTLTTRLK